RDRGGQRRPPRGGESGLLPGGRVPATVLERGAGRASACPLSSDFPPAILDRRARISSTQARSASDGISLIPSLALRACVATSRPAIWRPPTSRGVGGAPPPPSPPPPRKQSRPATARPPTRAAAR